MDRGEIISEDSAKNQVSAPPLQTPVMDRSGTINRAWSAWFRDVYRRVAYKGGNAIDANKDAITQLIEAIEENAEAIARNKASIEENALAIESNTESIVQNALAIAENADAITANADAIILLSQSLDSHVNAFEAHGSNGDIVGFNDLAEEAKAGLVNRMAAIADAIDTQVNIVTADIGPAPAAYDQAYAQSIADLVNENKAAINELAQDFSDAVAVLNNLLAESKLSGQMTE